MHIPPYYKKKGWQRFLAGGFIGGIIAYTIFAFMYGQMYERWVEENITLHSQVNELKKNNEILRENNRELDEKSKQSITVNKIDVSIDNQKQLKVDSLIVHQIEELIKEQVEGIIGEDINTLAQNYQLLLSSIENKTYKVDNFTYDAEVKQLLLISQTVTINVELKLAS